MSQVLDVGVGYKPRGDVNVDLYIDSRQRAKGVGPDLEVSKIQNFVQADGRDMPMFRDRQFHTVRCWHLIEHLPDPWNLLKELYRVTDKHLVIVCPSRYWLTFPHLRRYRNHISNFDVKTFEKGIPYHLNTWNFEAQHIYRGMFHKMIPFPLWPMLVRVDIWRE